MKGYRRVQVLFGKLGLVTNSVPLGQKAKNKLRVINNEPYLRKGKNKSLTSSLSIYNCLLQVQTS